MVVNLHHPKMKAKPHFELQCFRWVGGSFFFDDGGFIDLEIVLICFREVKLQNEIVDDQSICLIPLAKMRDLYPNCTIWRCSMPHLRRSKLYQMHQYLEWSTGLPRKEINP
jgi:hypothetical protein